MAPKSPITLLNVRRVGHILSIAFVTAGLVVILDAGITLAYQEPLSAIYGSVKQREAENQLEKIEDDFSGGVIERAVSRVRDERRQLRLLADGFATREAEKGRPIGRIRAPGMDGLDAVVIQGTDEASLQKGPGHYPETKFPGQGGTIGIAGHRTTYGAPFRHIDSMKLGDRIELQMPYGNFIYEVEKTNIVYPTDVGVVRPMGYERLVLSACHPLYSAEQRYIVFARLIRAKAKP